MRTKTGDRIASILRRHVGREEAIGAPDICRELGWPLKREREVRRIIADQAPLWEGVLVCAKPGDGYFVASNIDEAQAYQNWLNDLTNKAALKSSAFRLSAAAMGLHLGNEFPRLANAA